MKYTLLLAFLYGSVSLHAQHLSIAGHFLKKELPESAHNTTLDLQHNQIQVDGMWLSGSSVFKTAQGYVTLSGCYENAPSTLRFYNAQGIEMTDRTFRQTINFMLSPTRNYCAFQDFTQIHLFNQSGQEIKSASGSNVFAINDFGGLAYYDATTRTVHVDAQKYRIDEPVYRILFFQGRPLCITRKSILEIKNNQLITIYTTPGGRIFDAVVFDAELYVSLKSEQPGRFVFTAYHTADGVHFTSGEQVIYPNWSASNSRPVPVDTRGGEWIPDPLFFDADTAYQAVGNSYCEIQQYGQGATPYLHPGVDLFGAYLQPVQSVKPGYVKAILTTSGAYHWRIAIATENTADTTTGYLYAHLAEETIPYVVGDSVGAGDVVGQLVDFPVDGFVHCHFARLRCQGETWAGDWGTFDNPLIYMTNFRDSLAPVFEKTVDQDAFAFRQTNGVYLHPGNLYGPVRVISKVYDQVNTFWHVDVDQLRYSLSPLAEPATLLIDTLAYTYDFYNDFYYGGPYYATVLNTIYSRDSTCFSTGNYDTRDFYHLVTNSNGDSTIDGSDSLQLFNTLAFQNGAYIFRVIATDPSGNTTMDSMIIQINNPATGVVDVAKAGISVLPNPSYDGRFAVAFPETIAALNYTIYNNIGQLVKTGDLSTGFIDLSNAGTGIYWLQLLAGKRWVLVKLVRL